MKPFRQHSIARIVTPLLLAGAMALPVFTSRTAADEEVNKEKPAAKKVTDKDDSDEASDSTELPIPRSVFDDSSATGKDPFFPWSTRRQAVVSTPKPVDTEGDLAKAVVLKGISGTQDQRLAIINNRTFAVGESDSFSTSAGMVKVLVKEIREESVIVVINDSMWKELKLREGV